jgi:cation transport ATPase
MSLWWRIGGGAFLAMNAMVFSIALHGSEVTDSERYFLELTILVVSLPVFVLLSGELVAATWRALRNRHWSIEFLFLTGILASLAGSILFFVRGKGTGYADVAAMLLVVYALARQIGAYGKQRVLGSLSAWAPANRRVRRIQGRTEELVTSADLRANDRIRVQPGECVPADLRLLSPGVLIHEASITGESLAVRRVEGDLIRAGSFPLDSSIDGCVIGEGGGSEIDRVKELIESGLARPGVEQQLALDALRWFVPLVATAAIGTFLWHLQSKPWDVAVFIALSVAVIACPCALGFATPLAVWTGIERLRELGMIARSGDAVEKLAEINTVVFDKTGTLTLPEEYGVQWRVAPEWTGRQDELLVMLRDAEMTSRHPFSRILAPLWKDVGSNSAARLEGVRLLPGLGILGRFDDGRELFAGSEDREGGRLIVKVDGQLAATIELEEKQVPELSPAIASLERLGIEIVLVTGDSAARANAIPARTRLARRSPADKHALIQDLHRQGRKVLFAGDGLNDSAAMAWSHVACAAPDSVELVRDVCGLVFLHRDWRRLSEAIQIARKVRQVVRWNIAFSLTYNLAGIAVAVTGYLHPIASALTMTTSSLTVILYSMHLMDWETTDEPDADHTVRSGAVGHPLQPVAVD